MAIDPYKTGSAQSLFGGGKTPKIPDFNSKNVVGMTKSGDPPREPSIKEYEKDSIFAGAKPEYADDSLYPLIPGERNLGLYYGEINPETNLRKQTELINVETHPELFGGKPKTGLTKMPDIKDTKLDIEKNFSTFWKDPKYFTSQGPEGIPFAGGTIQHDPNTGVAIYKNPETDEFYRFTKDTPLDEIARNVPSIAKEWRDVYGFDPQTYDGVTDTGDLRVTPPPTGDQDLGMMTDYRNYFATSTPGQTLWWGGGMLTKNADGTATWTDGITAQTFSADTSMSELLANPAIKDFWDQQYGEAPTDFGRKGTMQYQLGQVLNDPQFKFYLDKAAYDVRAQFAGKGMENSSLANKIAYQQYMQTAMEVAGIDQQHYSAMILEAQRAQVQTEGQIKLEEQKFIHDIALENLGFEHVIGQMDKEYELSSMLMAQGFTQDMSMEEVRNTANLQQLGAEYNFRLALQETQIAADSQDRFVALAADEGVQYMAAVNNLVNNPDIRGDALISGLLAQKDLYMTSMTMIANLVGIKLDWEDAIPTVSVEEEDFS